jgi:hypothetical protein
MRGGTIATSFSTTDQPIIGVAGGMVDRTNLSGPVAGYPESVTDPGAPLPEPYSGGNYAAYGGRRRKTKKSVKAIKRLLKAKGLKVSGSRRVVTARARKARIPLKGGNRSPLSGGPYQSYQGGDGNADRGLATQFAAARPVNNNVLALPDTNGGSFYQTGSGGLVSA